jgi:hypothetical protein
MFGIENWVMNMSERSQIETAGNRFVRRVTGYTYADHVCNAAEDRILSTETRGIITS